MASAYPVRLRVHKITSLASSTQLTVSQSDSRAILVLLACRCGSIQMPAARYASVTWEREPPCALSVSLHAPKCEKARRGDSEAVGGSGVRKISCRCV